MYVLISSDVIPQTNKKNPIQLSAVWGATGSWWLLGKEESFSFRVEGVERPAILQERGPYACL